jgi:trimeric autotransporter adhesin
VLPTGDLLAGLELTPFGAIGASAIARWDGAAWSAFANPGVPTIDALALAANGDVYAAGSGVRRFDGTAWTQILAAPYVVTLLAMPNGDVVAGGGFLFFGSGFPCENIARWDGTAWHRIGGGITGFQVSCLATLPDGDLLAGGAFVDAMNVSGTTLTAAGAPCLARWNGSAWSALVPNVAAVVSAIARTSDDGYAFGGPFTAFAGVATNAVATISSACPATALPFGAGCNGPAGALMLAPRSRPWLGSVSTSQATGLAATSLAVVVHGFAPLALPLAPLLPAAGPGCFLFASPDALDLVPVAAGGATASLAIPDAAALLGVVVRQQVVEVELGSGAAINAIRTSNAVVLTLGTY